MLYDSSSRVTILITQTVSLSSLSANCMLLEYGVLAWTSTPLILVTHWHRIVLVLNETDGIFYIVVGYEGNAENDRVTH